VGGGVERERGWGGGRERLRNALALAWIAPLIEGGGGGHAPAGGGAVRCLKDGDEGKARVEKANWVRN
jgi:hypothetical protein